MNSLANLKPIVARLRRFHMVIFIVGVVTGLAIAVLLLDGIALKSSGTTASSTDSTKTSFDQSTIDRIKQLKTSSDPSTPLDLSKGRISPFSE